jgi:hypothetical protein
VFYLYNILINNDTINTVTHTLGILIFICEILGENGVDLILKAAKQFSKQQSVPVFQELILLLNDSNVDIKINCITLLYDMLRFIDDKEKVKDANLAS